MLKMNIHENAFKPRTWGYKYRNPETLFLIAQCFVFHIEVGN